MFRNYLMTRRMTPIQLDTAKIRRSSLGIPVSIYPAIRAKDYNGIAQYLNGSVEKIGTQRITRILRRTEINQVKPLLRFDVRAKINPIIKELTGNGEQKEAIKQEDSGIKTKGNGESPLSFAVRKTSSQAAAPLRGTNIDTSELKISPQKIQWMIPNRLGLDLDKFNETLMLVRTAGNSIACADKQKSYELYSPLVNKYPLGQIIDQLNIASAYGIKTKNVFYGALITEIEKFTLFFVEMQNKVGAMKNNRWSGEGGMAYLKNFIEFNDWSDKTIIQRLREATLNELKSNESFWGPLVFELLDRERIRIHGAASRLDEFKLQRLGASKEMREKEEFTEDPLGALGDSIDRLIDDSYPLE